MELTKTFIIGEAHRYDCLYNEWHYKYHEKKKELEILTRETEEARKYFLEYEAERNKFEKMCHEIDSAEAK